MKDTKYLPDSGYDTKAGWFAAFLKVKTCKCQIKHTVTLVIPTHKLLFSA